MADYQSNGRYVPLMRPYCKLIERYFFCAIRTDRDRHIARFKVNCKRHLTKPKLIIFPRQALRLIRFIWPLICTSSYDEVAHSFQVWASASTVEQMGSFLLGMIENAVYSPYPSSISAEDYAVIHASDDMVERARHCTQRLQALAECTFLLISTYLGKK